MLPYLRFLLGKDRTKEGNVHLGVTLAFVAGAVNAGGFLAVAQYTSHMTGIVSFVADEIALGRMRSAVAGIAAFVCFLAGAGTSAILINWARRLDLQSRYALPLALEAVLLLCFGLLGTRLEQAGGLVHVTVLLLCFTMGLQNAVVTKISEAEIRTTHVTGLATDLGIELGKLFYWNRGEAPKVLADRAKMRLLSGLLGSFAVGGVAGAAAFKRFGFVSAVPLACLLLLMAGVPVLDDLRR